MHGKVKQGTVPKLWKFINTGPGFGVWLRESVGFTCIVNMLSWKILLFYNNLKANLVHGLGEQNISCKIDKDMTKDLEGEGWLVQ